MLALRNYSFLNSNMLYISRICLALERYGECVRVVVFVKHQLIGNHNRGVVREISECASTTQIILARHMCDAN